MDNLNLDNYEVVRQEFFQSQEEAQLTFRKGYMYINSFGLNELEGIDYIQVLVDKQQHSLVIKPSEKKIKDSFRWSTSGRKRKPRHMRCLPMFQLIFEMMNWNTNARYRITGFKKYSKGMEILYFNLNEAVCFESAISMNEDGATVYKCIMPENWKCSFGISSGGYANETLVELIENDELFEVSLHTNTDNIA